MEACSGVSGQSGYKFGRAAASTRWRTQQPWKLPCAIRRNHSLNLNTEFKKTIVFMMTCDVEMRPRVSCFLFSELTLIQAYPLFLSIFFFFPTLTSCGDRRITCTAVWLVSR